MDFHTNTKDNVSPSRLAQSMLLRYPTAKLALDTAHHHRSDATSLPVKQYWHAVYHAIIAMIEKTNNA